MTDETTRDNVAETIVSRIDWKHPALTSIREIGETRDAQTAALAFVAYLRARAFPPPEYTPAYIHELRSRADASQLQAAREAVATALQKQPVGARLYTPLHHIKTEEALLGASPDMGKQIAANLLKKHDQWANNGWGTTGSIVTLLRRMLCLPECGDETLLPPLAWLLAQLPAEWAWARTWNESMLGNSGHNWWLHTFLGFFKAGLFFPEFKGFSRFQTLGAAYFERECLLLMEPDGFTKERSGYHYGTARMFFEFRDLAELFGFPLSKEFDDRIRAMADVEWKVRAPTCELPHLGDGFYNYLDLANDVDKETLEKKKSGSTLRLIAARFQLPEAKYVAEQLDPGWRPSILDSLSHNGRDFRSAYERLPARQPSSTDTELPVTGYYFMRQDWTPKADWVSIEAGTTGNIVSSHDHTDIFSIELFSRGRLILVDNGTAPYGNTPERLWRVGSASHNVATIDGKDQIPMHGEWRWKNTVTPVVDDWTSAADYAYFSGAHEGYRWLPERVASARRKLFYLRGRYWIMIDRFTPETDAEHEYTIHFHVAAPCNLKDNGQLATSGPGGNLLIIPVPGLDGQAAIEPCPYPIERHVRPDHLSYTRRGSGGQIFVTLLVPFDNETAPDVAVRAIDIDCDERTLEPWEATALEITIDGQRDIYFDQHMAWNLPWQAGGFSGEGRLFHSAVAR